VTARRAADDAGRYGRRDTPRRAALALALVALVTGCAATPATVLPPPATPVAQAAEPVPPPPAPMIESPPIEPVPPLAQAAVAVDPEPEPAPPTPATQVVTLPPPAPVPPPTTTIIVTPEPSAEDKEFAALLADLQRYGGLSPEDQRREQQAMTQALARTRSDAVRVRLAVLHTLTRQSVQDDQRALALFESVMKSNPGPVAIKQLATVLSLQVAERVRAVRDEQAKSEAAIQKLEALRAMERSLLRDRVRSGGGGGGAGSGGGN
jgi:hypothetical protein